MSVNSSPPITKRFAGKNGCRIDIILEDCLTGMKRLPDHSVSVVITSPPYNLGISYSTYDDTIPRMHYLDWIENWVRHLKRVLSPNASLFLNIGASPKDPWIPFDVMSRLREHLILQNVFHWIKSISIDGQYMKSGSDAGSTMSLGHYKPINSSRFVNDCHEYIFHLTPSGKVPLDRKAVGVPYTHKSNIRRWKGTTDDCRCRGNNWFIPYKTIQSRNRERPHPATFPVQLPEMCLKIHGLERIRHVLDPFSGIGSTALACGNLGCDFTGFEIDPDYFATSCDRLAEHPAISRT